MKKSIAVMTIAGSDSGGGAGIQADLKTFSALGVYGTTIITSVTAQNLNKITGFSVLPAELVHKQIKTVLNCYPVKAVKTGILYSEQIISIVKKSLNEKIRYKKLKLIIDPVMISTSGKPLIGKQALNKLQSELFSLASLITPNIPEAEFLSKNKISSLEDMKKTASILYEIYKVPFLIKGGHLPKTANDVLISEDGINIYDSKKISGINTHGSGCTLSAAITAFLGQDYTLTESINSAKEYMISSLLDPIQITENIQIINHFSNY